MPVKIHKNIFTYFEKIGLLVITQICDTFWEAGGYVSLFLWTDCAETFQRQGREAYVSIRLRRKQTDRFPFKACQTGFQQYERVYAVLYKFTPLSCIKLDYNDVELSVCAS